MDELRLRQRDAKRVLDAYPSSAGAAEALLTAAAALTLPDAFGAGAGLLASPASA